MLVVVLSSQRKQIISFSHVSHENLLRNLLYHIKELGNRWAFQVLETKCITTDKFLTLKVNAEGSEFKWYSVILSIRLAISCLQLQLQLVFTSTWKQLYLSLWIYLYIHPIYFFLFIYILFWLTVNATNDLFMSSYSGLISVFVLPDLSAVLLLWYHGPHYFTTEIRACCKAAAPSLFCAMDRYMSNNIFMDRPLRCQG